MELKRSDLFQMRIEPELKARIMRAAEQTDGGISTAQWIRQTLIRRLDEIERKKRNQG